VTGSKEKHHDAIPPCLPDRDIDETRRFYGEMLGCPMGRYTETGSISTCSGTRCPGMSGRTPGPVRLRRGRRALRADPPFRRGASNGDWKELAAKLEAADGIDWIMKPTLRFEGQPGEQATLFMRDPSGNALEFKGFTDLGQVFAS
jgi:extradiol dioxygenase family protein